MAAARRRGHELQLRPCLRQRRSHRTADAAAGEAWGMGMHPVLHARMSAQRHPPAPRRRRRAAHHAGRACLGPVGPCWRRHDQRDIHHPAKHYWARGCGRTAGPHMQELLQLQNGRHPSEHHHRQHQILAFVVAAQLQRGLPTGLPKRDQCWHSHRRVVSLADRPWVSMGQQCSGHDDSADS